MTTDPSEEFDPAIKELYRGAKENIPDLCAEFMGQARWGNQSANARALRIAAESGSYEAFERMLLTSLEGTGGFPGGPFDISLGPDWDKVNEIANSDERIATAFKKRQEQFDAKWDEVFGLLGSEDIPEPVPYPKNTP